LKFSEPLPLSEAIACFEGSSSFTVSFTV